MSRFSYRRGGFAAFVDAAYGCGGPGETGGDSDAGCNDGDEGGEESTGPSAGDDSGDESGLYGEQGEAGRDDMEKREIDRSQARAAVRDRVSATAALTSSCPKWQGSLQL